MTTKVIHEAALADIKELGANSAEFTIKPLYYGYGNTLGNSLRRVLLSSVKGAAITAFSIEGSTHEFAAIKGIREDVVDIMLNLKTIRFKCHNDNPVELTLEIKGSDQSDKDGDKRVVAGDIKLPADVEIANPNQVSATSTIQNSSSRCILSLKPVADILQSKNQVKNVSTAI